MEGTTSFPTEWKKRNALLRTDLLESFRWSRAARFYSTGCYFSSFEKLATAKKETLLSRRYSYASYNALLDYRAFFCEIITRKREREREREKRKREKQKRKLFVLTPGDRMQFCRGVFTCGTFDAWKSSTPALKLAAPANLHSSSRPSLALLNFDARPNSRASTEFTFNPDQLAEWINKRQSDISRLSHLAASREILCHEVAFEIFQSFFRE